jgi:hypothetical protein
MMPYIDAPDWTGNTDGTATGSVWPCRRLFRWAVTEGGGTVVQSVPVAGGDVDAIAGGGTGNSSEFYWATPGRPVVVEAGAAFDAGAELETDADGRAVAADAGVVVLRALQAAASAGDYALAVFTSMR